MNLSYAPKKMSLNPVETNETAMTHVWALQALGAIKNALPLVSPAHQDSLTKAVAFLTPGFLPFDKREMVFGRHPIHTLYQLIKRSINGEQILNLKQTLDNVPESLCREIYYEVWFQATNWNKGGDQWGEDHALNDHPRLLQVIKTIAERTFDHLPSEKKTALYATMDKINNRQRTDAAPCNEHTAKSDTECLIRALHRHQHLAIFGKTISFYSDLEKDVAQPSCTFHLNRRELACGQIGFHNGIQCSLEDAQAHALRLSNESAQQYNLHCTYGATTSIKGDLTSAFLGQGGALTPPVIQLLEQWQEFFEKQGTHRLLQICHSRGAIEVNNALQQLPQELRQRIIVITIAPACLIAEEMAYRVINLVIPSDPVVQTAANRDQLERPHTLKLANHSDTPDYPHNMHGSSFRAQLEPRIAAFIRTNDISL